MVSHIEWTEETWNPLIGCNPISLGCQNCYAREIALRLQAQGMKDYERGFELKPLPHRLNLPYSWKKPRKVFVNSMSDLFHKDVPIDFLKTVFKVMNENPNHLFQILTKRSDVLLARMNEMHWSDNIMMGVTIEADAYRHRLDDLKRIPARYKFICMEPLVAPIQKLDLSGIDWVIVGGESGPRARPMDINWVRQIRDWCEAVNVPFWFKQHTEYGGFKAAVLDGKTYKQEPDIKLQKTLFDF